MPINENDVSIIPEEVIKTMHSLRFFIVEKARTARRYIKSSGYQGKIDELEFFELDKHNPDNFDKSILQAALDGYPMGLMSEAGMPCIADPGSKVVALAHKLGIKVIPLSGPSSIFLALAASGMNGQSFKFEGYLPVKDSMLANKLLEVQKNILSDNTTHIFIETPYRNNSLIQKLLKAFHDNIRLCLAANISTSDEYIKTKTIGQWKKSIAPDFHKVNCVFLVGK